MRLHEAWVADAVVGGGCSYAAVALLHDDREDEARVDASVGADFLNGRRDLGQFSFRVLGDAELGTSGCQYSMVVVKP